MHLDTQKIWQSVLVNLELTISKANYNTWFKDTDLEEITSSGTAVVITPNAFVKKWISEKFNSDVLKFLIKINPEIRKVSYVIGTANSSQNRFGTSPSSTKPRTPKKIDSSELKKPISFNLAAKNDKSNLNPKYKFETFVVGSFNEVAYAASQAVIKRKEVIYNPLLIYGNTGYGKTHLIQAVGNYIKDRDPDKKICYITSEKFYIDVIDFIGLKSNKTNNFKNKYRQFDVFIMDDIQFLTKKERTQEELFHLFNYLYDNNKQIILSSDKHPNQIQDLEDRLKSRFNAGMIVDIQTPDYESRVEILKNKTRINEYDISNDIIEYVAANVTGNIRELEGILNNIFIQAEIKKHTLTLPEVKEIIKLNYKKKQPIDYKKLVEIVSNYYNIDSDNIYKKTRKKEFVGPRQIIMYLLREDFGQSYPSIGEKLGGRDHTTVMHSFEKISNALKTDNEIVRDIEQIRASY